MPPPLVKVCVLGSSAVGKSSLIEQFMHTQFEEPCVFRSPMLHWTEHNCASLLNGKIYHLQVIDMPSIKEFPATALAEWTQFQRSVLRTAHAYVFVFDLTTPATFYYVKVIRDQLFESRNMQNVPVWVVGNKADLCMSVLATMRSHRYDHHHQRALLHPSQNQLSCPYDDLMPSFKDLANLVRKQWKCSYLECSAKYNWHVVSIFREIVKSLDSSLPTNEPTSAHAQTQQSQVSSHKEISHLRSASIRGGMAPSTATSNSTEVTMGSHSPTDQRDHSESHSACRIV